MEKEGKNPFLEDHFSESTNSNTNSSNNNNNNNNNNVLYDLYTPDGDEAKLSSNLSFYSLISCFFFFANFQKSKFFHFMI